MMRPAHSGRSPPRSLRHLVEIYTHLPTPQCDYPAVDSVHRLILLRNGDQYRQSRSALILLGRADFHFLPVTIRLKTRMTKLHLTGLSMCPPYLVPMASTTVIRFAKQTIQILRTEVGEKPRPGRCIM